jgi:hypothetical protein
MQTVQCVQFLCPIVLVYLVIKVQAALHVKV